ncbi:uncharacterized protein LOC133386068 [Rhineura floridana]|uniref:uncharacterized protein LOC133386068 n=1 Tax=Rhineura floridana TaxID=261503 RepID=UPI002AC8519B|nr:uncharacterized protein LOC133386068 [Rhineura floridana]
MQREGRSLQDYLSPAAPPIFLFCCVTTSTVRDRQKRSTEKSSGGHFTLGREHKGEQWWPFYIRPRDRRHSRLEALETPPDSTQIVSNGPVALPAPTAAVGIGSEVATPQAGVISSVTGPLVGAGIVPKKAAGEFRLIHHLSHPRGQSVNDFIPDSLCTVHYTSFDAAVRMVRACGNGALMGKCDIKSAFRLLPVHPADFDLLGFTFADKFHVDRALPMGCSISCALFERFSTFLEWAIKRRTGMDSVVHYLDDFLFVGGAGTGECLHLMAQFQDLTEELGVPLAMEKTEGPAPVLTFLGIEIDSGKQCCRLPQNKLLILHDKIKEVTGVRKVFLSTLQELAGHLNFVCRVVAPGRAFLRHVYEAMVGLL